MTNNNVTFEEIVEQNERRIHYHIHRLNIRDTEQEFFQEGLVAMWNAYEKHQPDKGPFATYFNYIIRNRLIDLIRKTNREKEKQILLNIEQERLLHNGNCYRSHVISYPMMIAEKPITDEIFWGHVKKQLTGNQWKWVNYFIIENMSVKEIAEQEGVSMEAVKSWGKEARRKLKCGVARY